MREHSHVVDPVKELGETRPSTHPVTGSERVQETRSENIGTHCRCNREIAVAHAGPLKLVLDIPCKTVERDTEEVFHQVAGEFEPLVGVVVLVVDPALVEDEVETGLCHAAEEVCLRKPDREDCFL